MKDKENENMITYVSSYNSCVMDGLQISYKNIIYQGTSSIVVYLVGLLVTGMYS